VADTTFQDGVTKIVSAWLQDVNNLVYRVHWQPAGVPTGAVDGVNPTYTLPQLPVGSLTLYFNSLYAVEGVDYTRVGMVITKGGTPLQVGDSINYGEYRY
jgi:hypothetical protein